MLSFQPERPVSFWSPQEISPLLTQRYEKCGVVSTWVICTAWRHYPAPHCESQSLHPSFLLPTVQPCLKGHYLQGCLSQTHHRVSTATWVKAQAHARALTQIRGEFLCLLLPSPQPPSAPPGPGRSTAPASLRASHRQRAGREAQSWEQRIQSSAIRGKYHGNLSQLLFKDLRQLGQKGEHRHRRKSLFRQEHRDQGSLQSKSQLRKAKQRTAVIS